MNKDALEKLIESIVDWSRAYQHALDQGPESEAVACESELKIAKAELLAALAPEPSQPEDLHSKIMNIMINVGKMEKSLTDETSLQRAYKYGHRDARHAAAEIVAGLWRKVEP